MESANAPEFVPSCGAATFERHRRLWVISKAVCGMFEKLDKCQQRSRKTTINVCNQMKNMNNVLRKCIDGLQFPKYLRIDKSKNNTTKERVPLPEMVVPVEDILWPEYEHIRSIQDRRNDQLVEDHIVRDFDKIESAVEVVESKIKKIWESKINALLFLFREMDNVNDAFDKNMTEINDTIVKLVETDRIEKIDGFKYKRAQIVWEKNLNAEFKFSSNNPTTNEDLKLELRLKRIHNIMDRLYNIRLSNIERYVKSTEKSVFDICKQISILDLIIVNRLVDFQTNLFENFTHLKHTIRSVKLAKHVGCEDPSLVADIKFKIRAGLCGKLGDRKSVYKQAAQGSGDYKPQLSTVVRVKRMNIPEAFRCV